MVAEAPSCSSPRLQESCEDDVRSVQEFILSGMVFNIKKAPHASNQRSCQKPVDKFALDLVDISKSAGLYVKRFVKTTAAHLEELEVSLGSKFKAIFAALNAKHDSSLLHSADVCDPGLTIKLRRTWCHTFFLFSVQVGPREVMCPHCSDVEGEHHHVLPRSICMSKMLSIQCAKRHLICSLCAIRGGGY